MKTLKTKEVVIIGAGHNSLVAACLLAKRGKKVTIYEQAAAAGGLARGYDIADGFRSQGFFNDTTMLRSSIADAVELGRHGLKFAKAAKRCKVPTLGGKVIETPLNNIDLPDSSWGWSPEDCQAYSDYRAFFKRTRPFMEKIFDDTPPNLSNLGFGSIWDVGLKAISLRLLGRKDMMELLRRAPMCVADYLNEYFDDQAIKASFAVPATQFNYCGPWSPQTSLGLMIHETFRDQEVVGGSSSLVEALLKSAESLGVVIKLNTAVEALEIEDDAVKGLRLSDGSTHAAQVVLSGADPKSTMLKLLPRGILAAKTRHKLDKYRSEGVTAKIDFAMSSLPAIDGDQEWARLRLPASLDDLERAFDPIKYKSIGDKLSLDVYVPSRADSSLAPSGQHVVSVLVHHVPYDVKGGWATAEVTMRDTVVGQLDAVLPGFAGAIVGEKVLTPEGIETEFGAYHGHPLHGEQLIDQTLNRPTLDTANYRTPIIGLHMIGSGTHPGGGISGAPGALAVKELF